LFKKIILLSFIITFGFVYCSERSRDFTIYDVNDNRIFEGITEKVLFDLCDDYWKIFYRGFLDNHRVGEQGSGINLKYNQVHKHKGSPDMKRIYTNWHEWIVTLKGLKAIYDADEGIKESAKEGILNNEDFKNMQRFLLRKGISSEIVVLSDVPRPYWLRVFFADEESDSGY